MGQLPCRAIAVALILGFALVAGAGAQTPWPVPESEKHRKNPVATGAKVVEQGKKVAQVNCASCHGSTGKGNGPAAMALSPKPADWTSRRFRMRHTARSSGRSRPGGARCRRGST
jgi:mono/diheme cytochrome c family protein